MSYYSDASLVYIPAAVKNGKTYSVKPTDGTGDLTFTRASNATRVASNGLIEKVRTNVLLQSNSFDTTWARTDTSVTSGQSGYDGTSNAWLLNVTGGTGSQRIEQNVVSSTSTTYSIYLKAGTVDWVALRVTGTPVNCLVWFDLSTGTKGSNQNATNYTITSVGSGWYRCTLTTNTTIGAVYIYPATGDDIAGLNCTSGDNILIQNAQLEAGDIATDYIATTTAAVSVGPVSGLPRLDYLNSSCPRLLLEGQRSNLCLWSEQIDNAAWTKDATTATANQTASPSGYADADLVTNNGVSGDHTIYQTISLSATTYTVSAYVKKNTESYVHLTLNLGSNANEWVTASFNLDTATSANYSSVLSTPSSTITAFGTDGWYRVTMTCTLANAANHILLIGFAKAGAPDTSRGRYVTANTNSFYIWGCQTEAGTYATSYIPTLGTSVTRVGDDCQTTSLQSASLIGATAGTFFIETTKTDDSVWINQRIFLTNTITRSLLLDNSAGQIRLRTWDASSVGATITTSGLTNGPVKYLIKWDGTNVTVFANGAFVGSSAQPSYAYTTYSALESPSYSNNTLKQLLFFPTALTDAQCIELTA